jgi:nitrite reductase/ring-hydroxylating ferredoxin subunit
VAEDEHLICESSALAEAGEGIRFAVWIAGESRPAFAIRFGGTVHAYLNRCGHMPMELDWVLGRFFDADRRLLICSTHGALYDPVSGECRGGPCHGAGLSKLALVERDGKVYLSAWRKQHG